MGKYNEDARQDEKHVPDLLEAIMKPTDPVKEELRQKLFKILQFGSKIKKIRVSTFWTPVGSPLELMLLHFRNPRIRE